MSKEEEEEEQPHRAQKMKISAPQDPILHVPRPRLDGNGKVLRIEDHELDKETLEAALTAMAAYIHARHQTITTITVGGAVNTLLLQSRPSTHDVDFLGTNLTNDQRVLLDEAALHAETQSPTPLGGEWFNNHAILWLPPNVHREVTREALEQHEILFQRPGLEILVAPWHYALCGKMNRLVRERERRPYDVADAAAYLRQYVLRHGETVSKGSIWRWCDVYQKDTSEDVICAVNEEYRRLYGSDGISD